MILDYNKRHQFSDFQNGDLEMLKAIEYLAFGSAIVFAVCLIALMFFYASSPPASQPPHQQHAEENQTVQNGSETNRPFWPKVRTDPVTAFTLFLVIFTAILSGVGVIQLKLLTRAETVAEKSANAAQQAADVARNTLVATNRPWVSVDLAIVGPLTYTQDEARIEIAFILKNTGTSPAVNVQVDAEIALFTDGRKPALDVMKEICKRAKDSPDDNAVLGHTIFKDREFTSLINIGKRKSDVENSLDGFAGVEKGKNDWFTPVIVGCVSYRFPFQKGRHITEFLADLRKINQANPRVPLAFKMSDGDVPANQLILTRSFIGGNAD